MLLPFEGSSPLLRGEQQPGSQWVSLDPLESEPPLRIGRQKQLLVDNEVLCDWSKVRRVQEKVRKHVANPILEADRTWEQRLGGGIAATAVLYDPQENLYKLWYRIEHVVGYATSRDGIKWIKPDLGLVEYAGTRNNNLCRIEPFGKPLVGCLHLIQDTRSREPDRRYMAIGINPYHEGGTLYGGWLGIAASGDGTTWRMVDGGLREGAGGGCPSCLWDERLGRYVLFHRELIERASLEGLKRYVVRQESEDLKRWSPRRTVVNPMDPEWPEIESMMVFQHEGVYFGLANMLDSVIKGEVELHLWISRDGLHWEHPFPQEAFIPRGPRGDFDDMITWMAHTVIRGNEMRFYYSGARYPHSKPGPPIVDDEGSLVFSTTTGKGRLDIRVCKIGLATVPMDRLIALRADEPVGAFLTRPLLIEGDELYVNANVDRELRVEVVNPAGKLVDAGPKGGVIGHYIAGQEEVYSGFRRQDCQAITGDSLAHRVRWKDGPIGHFKGQAVRLRFLARMADIYSFHVR
jgi:hypothetical protein